MKILYLASNFNNAFPKDFIGSLKEHYCANGTMSFVASDFESYSKTDKYKENLVKMFDEGGINFRETYTIDNRTPSKEANHHIQNSDIVWISGGDVLKQINSIKNYELIPSLKEHNGITVGISAGAINMAKRVVLAKNIEEGISELSIYDGIGLTNINIEPHLNPLKKEHMKDIREAAKYTVIYGLHDDAYIKVIEDSISIHGKCKKFSSPAISGIKAHIRHHFQRSY